MDFLKQASTKLSTLKKVANYLGTDHHELYVSASDAAKVIFKLPEIYDEPFADSSQIPTAILSQMTANHVKVALSGDGGDEIFGGYNRYIFGQKLLDYLGILPVPVRGLSSRLITALTPAQWDNLFKYSSTILPKRFSYSNPGDKIHKLSGLMNFQDSADLYNLMTSFWNDSSSIVIGEEDGASLERHFISPDRQNFIEYMMLLDTQTYLPDDILVKVDRAAMASSLETRCHF